VCYDSNRLDTQRTIKGLWKKGIFMNSIFETPKPIVTKIGSVIYIDMPVVVEFRFRTGPYVPDLFEFRSGPVPWALSLKS
jgi:hypothetical protein